MPQEVGFVGSRSRVPAPSSGVIPAKAGT